MALIPIPELEDLCKAVLRPTGMREKDIDITVDHFLENELSGKTSHGMVRIVEAVRLLGQHGVSHDDPEIITDTGTMVVIDAKGQTGTVAGKAALDVATGRAKTHGIAFVGIRGYVANSGSMAYYLRRMTSVGLIGLMGTNSVAMVAPPGGRQRMIGTNPVGIGIPGEDEAMIADFATSAMAYGKMMVLRDKGEPVPEVLVDKDGNPSTDPLDAYEGAILPLADYRGFALGLMVELLSGPLIGGKASKDQMSENDGLFIIAIDPKKLGSQNFTHEVTDLFMKIRKSPTQKGVEEITLPGDRSSEALAEAKMNGTIEVVDKTLEDLKSLALKDCA